MDFLAEIILELIAGLLELILEGTFSGVERGIRNRFKRKRSKYDNFKLAMFIFSLVLSFSATIVLLVNKDLKPVYISLYCVGGTCFMSLIIIRAISVVKFFRKHIKLLDSKSKKILIWNFMISIISFAMFFTLFTIGRTLEGIISNNEIMFLGISCYSLFGIFIINFIVGLVIFSKYAKKNNTKLSEVKQENINEDRYNIDEIFK